MRLVDSQEHSPRALSCITHLRENLTRSWHIHPCRAAPEWSNTKPSTGAGKKAPRLHHFSWTRLTTNIFAVRVLPHNRQTTRMGESHSFFRQSILDENQCWAVKLATTKYYSFRWSQIKSNVSQWYNNHNNDASRAFRGTRHNHWVQCRDRRRLYVRTLTS